VGGEQGQGGQTRERYRRMRKKVLRKRRGQDDGEKESIRGRRE